MDSQIWSETIATYQSFFIVQMSSVAFVFEGETEFKSCRNQLAAFIPHICANDKTTSFNISVVNKDLDENG